MRRYVFLVLAMTSATTLRADPVVEWNVRASEVITASRLSSPAMYRTAAIVQVAVLEAVGGIKAGSSDTSIDAAVAAATRGVLVSLIPEQESTIEAAYQTALHALPESAAKTSGISAGERAAAQVLASRADDDSVPDTYRPHAAPGAYVPTTLPAGTAWSKRKPWFLARGDNLRPDPPPHLDSDIWARDYNEVRLLGGRVSMQRTAEQTAIARFWSAVTPALYFAVARSAIDTPSRRNAVAENARLLAVVAMAMDDALIAVLDAKYTYNLWRPITAIRNADRDDNPRTDRDAGWLPLIETPLHPEYPCGHCILAGTVGTVLEGAVGRDSMGKLSCVSPATPGVIRTWAHVEDLMQEVALARVYAGVHYRNSTEVGVAMGKKIGKLALTRYSLAR